MPKAVPCLWFDGQAEQAAAHYTAIFPNSEVLGVVRYGPDTPGPEGSVMAVSFNLDGQRFAGINGGPRLIRHRPENPAPALRAHDAVSGPGLTDHAC